MNITRGKRARAQKVVVYGPEGVGKSSLASRFPDPLFIDTEGSTDNMDVARLDKPTSWTMIQYQIDFVKVNPTICKTLVIDTIDWAERFCIEAVCANHGKNGIEEFGWGNGYTYVFEEFGRFLNKLSELVDLGINVVLTAHAQIRKFDQPDEMGSFDRYELKLGKKTSSLTAPLVKEWADMILFCNYKNYLVTDDKTKKQKAQGGQRVIYTEHHPAWDAKNRHGLPFELPMNYDAIAHIFNVAPPEAIPVPMPQNVQQPVQQAPVQQFHQPQQTVQPVMQPTTAPVEPTQTVAQPNLNNVLAPQQDELDIALSQPVTGPVTVDPVPLATAVPINSNIPVPLQDLMRTNNVTEDEVMMAVESKGYYPKGTPIQNYDQGFISGVLIGAWNEVYKVIEEIREIPF